MTKFFRTLYNRIVEWMNQPHLRRPIAAMLLLTAAIQMWAAGNGMAGINEATSMVTSYFDPATKLVYAIGAVVGLIGGVKVYSKLLLSDKNSREVVKIRAGTYCRSQPFVVTLRSPKPNKNNHEIWAKVVILADSHSMVR